MDWPTHLQINAWSGAEQTNRSDVDPELLKSVLARRPGYRGLPAFPTPLNLSDWQNPNVGWGLLLPDSDNLSDQQRATAEDAPEPVRRLLAHRGGALLRYRRGRNVELLDRYYPNGSAPQSLKIGASFGLARSKLPYYVLIYGSPTAVPWAVQYQLQVSHFVGRIDLSGQALENYVSALISDWGGGAGDGVRTLAWAADDNIGGDDITRKMRTSVAAPVAKAWATDEDLKAGSIFLDGANTDAASIDALTTTLAQHKPAVIVTTSHGKTGPLDDVDEMRRDLGLLVDRQRAVLRPDALLSAWQPNGAIWYAHACCSAGSVGETSFDGLVTKYSDVDRLLKGIAHCGAMTSPLPTALLGCASPLKAFIGHVEPTFDWSIAHKQTGQHLTACLVEFLYHELFLGKPVGLALAPCRRFASQLIADWQTAAADFSDGQDTLGSALALELNYVDWRAFVLIGDPTVRVSLPPAPIAVARA